MYARRLGRLFAAADGPNWMASHAAYPAPVLLESNRMRIFFVSRDGDGRGTVGWVDVSTKDPRRIIAHSREPALRPGPRGSFDDRGIAIGSVVRYGNALRLYYMGWNIGVGVPFRNAIGLAVSADRDGSTFNRVFDGPVLDRSRHDPYSLSYPFVIDGASGWRMIYGSHRGPGTTENDMRHALMGASSFDGIDWAPGGQPILDLEKSELGHSRPWIMSRQGKRYLMFSVRRSQYTVGLAVEQSDGTWGRVPELSFCGGTEDWDREAQCYASHFSLRGNDYILYNGNEYGRTGFGLAILED